MTDYQLLAQRECFDRAIARATGRPPLASRPAFLRLWYLAAARLASR